MPRRGSLLPKEGLAINDQSRCQVYGEIGYHDFEGFAQEADDVPRILNDLGNRRQLIIWNRGLLSVSSAFRRLSCICAG
jgi:hypothetical protein